MYALIDAFTQEEEKKKLHLIDPRAKLLLSSVFVVISAISDNVFVQLVLLSIPLVLGTWGGVVRRISRSLVLIIPLALMVFIANLLVIGDPHRSLTMALRLPAMILWFSLFFVSTSPDDFISMMESLRIPPVISLSFSLALRFVPVMAEEAQRILDAQTSRGLEFSGRNPIKRIKSMLPVLIPLIVVSIKRSIEVAEALEIKGYDPDVRRTHVVKLEFCRRDWAIVMLSLWSLIAYLIARFVFVGVL